MLRTLLLPVLLIGCNNKSGTVTDTGIALTDSDGDGYPASEDCDDNEPSTNPSALELCDGVDNNCDGVIDEDVTMTWYLDEDGDGFGDASQTTEACEPPVGYSQVASDCDDSDSTAYPGAAEVCDGVDNNCNKIVDEKVQLTFYMDADGDGFGDPDAEVESCDEASGLVSDDSDCDDRDAAVNPDADEICNGIDDDCDERIDDDDPSITGAPTWYADEDGDGFGDLDETTASCEQPRDTLSDATRADCDDDDDNINPDATEVCDGEDNDCDGDTDEDDAADAETWYADADEDGFGDPDASTAACEQPSGYLDDDSDCDDSDAAVNPGATEVCNEVDDNCDGDTDEGVTTTYYADDDGDGFGDTDSTTEACAQPSGYLSDDSDCDDDDDDINPDATEVCDGEDNDCDGDTDEDADDTEIWYADDDDDGFGDPDTSTEACDQPSGYLSDDSDCDDTTAATNPDAEEVCGDGIDNDCDGTDDTCVTEHCGTITSDETWAAADEHLVTCNVFVQGSTRPELTIEDGAVVEFSAGTGMYIASSSYGSLSIEGTSTGVLLTSAESSPTAGDWQDLAIGRYDQGSVLQGATIEYGGGSGVGAINVAYASPEVTDCTISDSYSEGIYLSTDAVLTMTGTTISDNNGIGVYVTAGAELDTTDEPSFTDNVITANAANPITLPASYLDQLDASSSFSGNTDDAIIATTASVDDGGTWQALDADYRIDGNVTIEGSSAPEIVIEAGATLAFESGANILVGNIADGGLWAAGTASNPVIFTSADPSPSAGDWEGLRFGSSCIESASILEYTTVEYGGDNGYGNVILQSCDATISNADIRDSSHWGIYRLSASPSLSSISYSNNSSGNLY